MLERDISLFLSGEIYFLPTCGELECLCATVQPRAGLFRGHAQLNEASVDIDQEPLGDYENGHIWVDDVEDVEEVEGDDDELEEVDAGTYEDAASKKEKHLTRRTSNYTELEDEALIKAWDSITLDGVTGPIKPISGIDNGLRTSISISCLGLHIGHQGRTPHYKVDGMQSSLHVAGGPLALTK
jgi:hypothetical protein